MRGFWSFLEKALWISLMFGLSIFLLQNGILPG
jgi:hypothetical protein